MPLIPTGGTLADAVTFYTEKLGFEIASQWEGGGEAVGTSRIPHDCSIRSLPAVLSAGAVR